MLQASPDTSPLSPPAEVNVLRRALYARSGGTIREGVWIGDIAGWTLEFRATWAPNNEATTLAEVDGLTARARESAGTQQSLCAKRPRPSRDGALVTDKDSIQMSLISETVIEAAASEGTKNDSGPLVWCAEDVIGDGENAMLAWHAVGADGNDAMVDHVTTFTVGEPLTVTSAANSELGTILGEMHKNEPGKQRWTVSADSENGHWIYAFYDGRPDTAALAKIGNDILDHKITALGGYNAKDKKITIVTPEKN